MPIMDILCLGLNYRSAPAAVREQLTCTLTDLNQQRPFSAFPELALLATCHRLELYAKASEADLPALTQLLTNTCGVDSAVFAPHLYHFAGEAAVAHLCRVATGLDSLVLGEPQILGQVSQAYQTAIEAGSAGPTLSAPLRAAIRAGKRARTETAVGQNPASLSSVAIAQAQQAAGDLHQRHILVIGLGEMGQLALKTLQSRGIQQVSLINRTRARAEAIARQKNYQVFGIDELPQALETADVIITATASPSPLITADLLRSILHQRPNRPLVLLDLAMPRDVETAVSALPGVLLFNIDSLQTHLDESLAARQAELPRVEAIIAQELAAWKTETQTAVSRPVIYHLRDKAERIRQRELERTLRHLGSLDPHTLTHINHLSRSLVNKLLHEPTARLRQQASNTAYIATVRHLFDLPEVDS